MIDEHDHVLRPFDVHEAAPVSVAAKIAGVSARTMQHWCVVHRIGRRIANGPWRVSRPALFMLLDGDNAALRAYLLGERAGRVAAYFRRAV